MGQENGVQVSVHLWLNMSAVGREPWDYTGTTECDNLFMSFNCLFSVFSPTRQKIMRAFSKDGSNEFVCK